ncbi:MAG: discoidin domain-containing protein [bacterium]
MKSGDNIRESVSRFFPVEKKLYITAVALVVLLLGSYGLFVSHTSEPVYSVSSQLGSAVPPFSRPGVWHMETSFVDFPSLVWILADFGSEETVTSLAARPRPDLPEQIWKIARLEGSQDALTFTKVADINRDSASQDDDWLTWRFQNKKSYRYYRISIIYPFSKPVALSDLKLLPVEHRPVYSSSPHMPSLIPDNLGDDNPSTIWHTSLEASRVSKVYMAMVDLGRRNEQVMTSFSISDAGKFRKEIRLEGSQDGAAFERIVDVDEKSADSEGSRCKWNIENNKSYRFYRILVTDHIPFPEQKELLLLKYYVYPYPFPFGRGESFGRVELMTKAGEIYTPNNISARFRDGVPSSFWHSSTDLKILSRPSWIKADFGCGKIVTSLDVRPRPGFPGQTWKRARLEGSEDRLTFRKVMDLDREDAFEDNDWLKWRCKNNKPYRYYRIFITDPLGKPLAISDIQLHSSFMAQIMNLPEMISTKNSVFVLLIAMALGLLFLLAARKEKGRALISQIKHLGLNLLLFLFVFLRLSNNWWLEMKAGGHAENDIFTVSSSYIARLWSHLVSINSFSGLYKWILAFIFQLAPYDFGEKPLFVMLLGYFGMIYRSINKIIMFPLPVDAMFNLVLILFFGYLTFLMVRRSAGIIFGYFAAILIYLNVGLTNYSLTGYHTTLSIAVLSVFLLLYSNWKTLTGKRLFILGFVLSFGFFASHHFIAVFFPACAFVLLFTDRTTEEPFLRRAVFFLSGCASLFIYFLIRDAVLYTGILDSYRQSNVALYLDRYTRNNHPFVYKALTTSAGDATKQLYSRDFSFIYYYTKSFEGLYFFWVMAAGMVLPFLYNNLYRLGSLLSSFGVASAETPLIKQLSNPDRPDIDPRLTRLFKFCVFILLFSLLFLSSIPLPYMGRVYLPMVFLLLLAGTLGFAILYKSTEKTGKALIVAAICLTIIMQGINYRKLVRTPKDTVEVSKLGTSIPDLRSAKEITGYLRSLGKTDTVYLEPLVYNFRHHAIYRYYVYNFFRVLMQKGLYFERKKDRNRLKEINTFFISEHAYLNLMRQKVSGGTTWERYLSSFNIMLSDVFNVRSYYVFKVGDIFSVLKGSKPEDFALPAEFARYH